jgi:hypothetical protein
MDLYAVMGIDAGEVERVGADGNKRGRALLATGTAPILAEGTAGIEPASRAERATAAKPEVRQSFGSHRFEMRLRSADALLVQCKPRTIVTTPKYYYIIQNS